MSKDRKIIDSKYVIDRLIGTGGVAFVYKAWDTMLHKYVAIKKIHEEYAEDAKFVDMFRKEAVNTAKLEHENIVRVVNFVKEKGDYYMIMDYVNGVDLEYLINKSRKRKISVPPEIAVHIMAEIVKALDYAHNLKDELTGETLNIVHRDISPGNIMLYYNGKVKLADFGIAKAGDAIQEDEGIKGKVSYMSPEQARCEEVDARSDIFCCGLVLYEILTGEKAYKGGSDIYAWKKAKEARVNLKTLKKKNISEDIIAIIERAVKQDPSQRYQRAAEMFIDFKKYLSEKGSTEELKKKHSLFLKSALSEEIEASEQEFQKDMHKKYEIYETEEKNRPTAEKELYETKELDVSDEIEEERTGRGKIFGKIFFTALVILAVVFGYFDLQKENSFIKKYSFDLIFSENAELRIDTVPSDANIEIIDASGNNILTKFNIAGRTPLYIPSLNSGIYTIKSKKDDFKAMNRRMTVIGVGSSRAVFIANSEKKQDDIYVLPFDVDIKVNSQPEGANLYINNRSVGKTPYTGVLKAGVYNFQMEKPGYEAIGIRDPDTRQAEYAESACVLDLSKPAEEQTSIDYKFWEVEESKKNGKYVTIYGFLEEKI